MPMPRTTSTALAACHMALLATLAGPALAGDPPAVQPVRQPQAPPDAPPPEPPAWIGQHLIEPELLAELLHRLNDAAPPFLLIDLRPADSARAGRAPHARQADPTALRDESLLPNAGADDIDQLRLLLQRIGLSAGGSVVVYDDGRMTDAARLWFLAQLAGARQTTVVNGGWPALETAMKHHRIAPLAGPPPTPEPADFFAQGPPPASRPTIPMATREQVRSSVAPTTQPSPARADSRPPRRILDARSEEEHAGHKALTNLRTGHIPGALNLPYTQLMHLRPPPHPDPDHPFGRLLPPGQLAERFQKAGLQPAEPITVHCQTGGRAALVALALTLAGYADVQNYYRSFADWQADASCPLVPPAQALTKSNASP